jgi:transposase
MANPIAPDYGQQFLLPPSLEDWVGLDHPVRFLREFVDQLDLPALGFSTPTAREGRPPYAQSLLLKIWLYGYFHRIRSTRKLEAACREHIGLIWLTGMIAPDHNSLWRFWRDNKKALRTIFKQTVRLALHTGAIGLVVQAIDGTKIQAAASGHSGWTKEYMEKLLAELDKVLNTTELQVVKENSDENPDSGYRLPKGLAECKALQEEIKAGLTQLAIDGRKHYHPVEPEARRMKVEGRNRFGYNAQAVADGKEGIIVACEATRQETDTDQLLPMLERARENLGLQTADQNPLTLADSGYGAGAELKAAQEAGLSVLAPPAKGPTAQKNPYAAQHFQYNEHNHTVCCPQGRLIDHEGHTTQEGVRIERFRCHHKDCPVRDKCTRDPKGRQIEVWPHTPVVQKMRERLKDPAVFATWKERGTMIEPRFAQLKEHDGFRRWTVWGLESVQTQWSLLCATLNLRVLYRRWRLEKAPKASDGAIALEKPVSGAACPRKRSQKAGKTQGCRSKGPKLPFLYSRQPIAPLIAQVRRRWKTDLCFSLSKYF